MPAGEVAGYLSRLRRVVRRAGACTEREVLSVRRRGPRLPGRHRRRQLGGADAVVVATGCCDAARRSAARAAALHPRVRQLTPDRYRNPDSVPDGGVLVVGASRHRRPARRRARGRGPGCRAGRRPAHPAAPPLPRPGHHVVAGRDGRCWTGPLDHARPAAGAVAAARRQPDGRDVDLLLLAGRGVRLAGRLDAVDGRLACRSPTTSPPPPRRPTPGCIGCCTGSTRSRPQPAWTRVDPAEPPAAGAAPAPRPPRTCRLAGIRSVVWATGYRRQLPVAARPGARPDRRDPPSTAPPRRRGCSSSVCRARPGAARRFSTVSGTTPRSSSTPRPSTCPPLPGGCRRDRAESVMNERRAS